MQVSTTDGKRFALQPVTPEDQALIDALYIDGRIVRVSDHQRVLAEHNRHFNITGVTLEIDPTSPESARAEAGREALRTLGQLFRLGLGEAAKQGHVGTAPTDPHTQEQLVALLVEVKAVVESLRSVVLHHEIMVQKGQGTHGQSPVVEAAIVGASGTAVQGGAA